MKTESFKGALLLALVITSIMAPILVVSILTTGVSATHTPTVSIDKDLVKANTSMVLTITVQNAAGSDPIENVQVILPTVFTGLAPLVEVPKDNTVELAAPDNENVVLKAGTKVKLTGATTVTIPENTWLIRLANDNVFYENQAGTDSENLRLVDNVRIKKNATVGATGLTENDNVITVAQTTVSLNENDVVTLADTIVVRVTGNIVRLPENTWVKVHDDTNCRAVTAKNVMTEKEKTIIVDNGSNWVTEDAVMVVVIKTGLQGTLPAGAWVRLWLKTGESDENRVVLSAGSKVRLAAGTTTVMLYENESVVRVAPGATENIYLTDPASAENKPKNWTQSTGTSILPSGPYVEWVGIAENQIAGGASLDFPFAVTTPSGTAYTIYVKTTDTKGATVQKGITLTVDNVPPTVTIAASPSWVKDNVAVTITVKASEPLAKLENVMVAENNAPENTQVTMTSADSITWTGTYTTGDNWRRDGTAKIYVIGAQFEDLVGNKGTDNQGTFTVDRCKPPKPDLGAITGFPVDLGAAPGIQTNIGTWILEGIANDNFLGAISVLENGTVRIRVGAATYDVSAYATGYFFKSITLTEGTQEVGIRYIDLAGNVGEENAENVTYDKTKPSISMTSPAAGSIINDNTPKFVLVITDAVMGVENAPFNAADNSGYTVQLRMDDNTVIATLTNALAWDRNTLNFENQWPTELPDGWYNVFVIAGDNLQSDNAYFRFMVQVQALTSHDPIYIEGNDNFTPANGVVGGSGTENDPYIIENWDISAENANGIDIRNTTAFFIIRNCHVHDGYGIYLYRVKNGKIDNVTSNNNFYGIYLEGEHLSAISNNVITNSIANNNEGTGIFLKYASNNVIMHSLANEGYMGITISQSDFNVIENCVAFLNRDTGIFISGGSDNNIIANSTSLYSLFGISIDVGEGNIIENCVVSKCTYNIRFDYASNNFIRNSTISNAWNFGIFLQVSDNNCIYHDNIVNNAIQAYDSGINYWDNGYPSGGNYWSDYTGVDNYKGENQDIPGSDGIGDTPYYIPGDNNRDRYPLMRPWAIKPRAEIRAVIYPAADVYAFSGDGARYSRSQLKFDIGSIPSGSNVLSAKLWLYRFAADSWDGEVLLNRVDDQLWGENITAIEFDAETLTNEETQASKFMSPGWDYLDVEDQLTVDHGAGHAYSSYRLRWANDDGSEPSVGIDDGRFLVIESELDELCIIFPSSEYNGSDPYLEVVYVPPYAVSVSISPTYRSGAPGEELSYAVMVANTGNLDDNYVLTVSDNTGWGPTLGDNLLEVPAGEDRQTTLSVIIPAGAENCTRDNITVTVISQADNTVRDNTSCIAHALRVGLIPRGPIYIDGDDNFIPANGVTSGSGTENDPYIIENWDISAENANGIWVENTTLYFVVRNCYVHDGWNNGKFGIYLDPVINGIIENNIVENNSTGIYLEYSDNNIISNNIVRKNLYNGIRLDYSHNNVIYNNTVENNSLGIRLYSSDNNLISNNTCENNSSKGIYLDLSDNNLIENNICKNNNDHGIYLGSSYNNLIENCVVKNNQGHGIDLEPYCYNNIISNCLAENNRDWGIVLVYSDNNLIENCVAKYNMQGIALCSSDNNTITNYAGENNDWGIVLNSSQNDLIKNCICMNNVAGIEFDNSSNNNVENCIAGGNSGVGIVLGTSDNNLVENCTVENSGGDGILLEYSDNNTLDNNTSKNNDSSGIRFYYSDNNLLNNCTISNNGSNGIQLNNSGNNLIENCVAKNNYGAGIAIYDNSSNNLLENNLTENDSTGIDLYYSDNNTLTNNTCLNNYNQGIRLYFSSNNLLGNNLTKNNNSKGIELENADNNIISNNIVENNNEYGIFLLDSNDDTLNNNICENNLRGIDLNRSGNNTLDNNTCANNEWDGILLEFDSDNNRISNNTCENNDGFGIYLGDSDNNRIESNTCENNGLDGILIGSSDNNLIKNCTAKNNDACGISFGDSDNNSLTNNTCENNNANGINLYHSSTNTLTNNSCSNNYSHGIMLENSDNNLVRNCTTENNRNEDGIQLVYSYNNIVENCAAENNVNTGIHLIYSDTNLIKNCVLKNNYGCAIDFYSSDNNTVENCAAENNIIWIYDSDNNLIENCTASNNNGDGIHLGNSDNNLIKSCTISNSGTNAIALDNSDNNLIDNCTIWNNYGGIALWRSMNNIISNNIAENNGPWSSIYLGESENNTVTYNTCENNGYGVWLSNSNNNHIYHNNFINNVNQAYDDGSNYWDNGYPSGGNYWSDYTGVDEKHGENQNIPGSDGIGDTPYYISGGTNRDRYPLMSPWVVPPPVIEWDALITATFSGGSDGAIFGARLDASSGFDIAYDIPEPPAPPEPPYVRAYFYYPEQVPDELHRSCLAPENLMKWPLRIEYSEGPTDITLTWNVENIPLEYSVLLYRGGASVADMRAEDNYTFEAASDNHDFRVIVGKLLPFTLELTQGWNMISFPILTENMSPDSIFEGYYVLYRWDAENKRYVLHADSGDFIEPDPDVEVGVGYWAYLLEDENLDLLGFPVERLNLSLRQGWNLIGTPYGGSSIADPADDPDDSVLPWAFTWNAVEKRYDMTQLLEAGKGYWVYTLQDCSLTMERKVTMGFVLGGYIEGSTWDGRYIIAAKRLQWLYPWFDYAYDEGVVLEGRDPASSARDLITTKKANLVVGSWEPCAVPSFETIKGEYPEVWFLGNIGSDITRGGNFLRFFPRQYQAMYLEGLVAGALTRTNKIGIVVGPPCVQNWRRMAAFYLGIKEVNPDATLYIKYVGEWYNPTVERDVSLALVDLGCDVLTNYTDSTAPVEVCEEREIWYVGKDMDIVGMYGWSSTDTVAVSFDTRWEVIWDHFAKEYRAGVKAPETLVFLGMDDHIAMPADNPWLPGQTLLPTVDLQNDNKVGIDAISPKARPLIPDNVIKLIENRREQMMRGQWDPFFEYELRAGVESVEIPGVAPARTPGELVKPKRTAVSDEFLLGAFNFSLEGIVKVT